MRASSKSRALTPPPISPTAHPQVLQDYTDMHALMSKPPTSAMEADRELIRDARITQATALLVAAYATGADPIAVKRATAPTLNKMSKTGLTPSDLHPTLADAIAATKKYKKVAA